MEFLLNLFRGFRWLDKQHNFDSRYTQPYTRHNQHVLICKGKWCVHPEGVRNVQNFPDRAQAIAYAKKTAAIEGTEAVIHNEDGTIETAWLYSVNAYPKESIYPPEAYPLEERPT